MLFIFRKRKEAKLYNSEPDIASKKAWDSGFPPGTTVDELHRYRKKRPQGYYFFFIVTILFRHKNMFLGSYREYYDHFPTEGSYQSIKSEYKRRYRNHFLDDLQDLTNSPDIVVSVVTKYFRSWFEFSVDFSSYIMNWEDYCNLYYTFKVLLQFYGSNRSSFRFIEF